MKRVRAIKRIARVLEYDRILDHGRLQISRGRYLKFSAADVVFNLSKPHSRTFKAGEDVVYFPSALIRKIHTNT